MYFLRFLDICNRHVMFELLQKKVRLVEFDFYQMTNTIKTTITNLA